MSTHGGGGSRTPGRSVAERGKRYSGSSAKASANKPEPVSALHERAARLQREGGLRAETQPGAELQVEGPNRHRGTDEGMLNPAAPRADQKLDIYGEHNLGAALARYNNETLKGIAERAGVTPARTKAETISRITSTLTNGRYSANFPKGTQGTRQRSARSANGTSRTTPKQTEAAKAPRTRGTRTSRTTAATRADDNLKPIRQVDYIVNPAAAPNAHFLRALYGDAQLSAALSRYPMSRLRETAANLGVKVGRSRETTIQRIYDTVTREPYHESLRRVEHT